MVEPLPVNWKSTVCAVTTAIVYWSIRSKNTVVLVAMSKRLNVWCWTPTFVNVFVLSAVAATGVIYV